MNTVRFPLVAGLLVAGMLGLAQVSSAYSSRALSTPETGGPFPGEQVCARCHQGSEVNSGSGSLQLLVGEVSASDYMYTPGQTVTLIVQFTDATVARSGFQLTARSGDGCGQPGTLADTGATPAGTIRVQEATCGTGGTVQLAGHRRPEVGTTATWQVNWTPPDESVGPVTVAVAVNGTNGNGARTGDKIYTSQAILQPVSAQAPPPAISENGVVLGDRASMTTTMAPGAIAVASGSDFSKDGSTVPGTVDASGLVSTMLAGTCIEVNQQFAPLIRLANAEVIFQVPFESGLGAGSVQVVRDCGEAGEQRSNSASVTVEAVKPVFYLFSEASAGIAGLHTDLALVGPADAVEGVESRPALPGDIVTVFGTGFGPTSPALATGAIAIAPASLATTDVRPMIGQMEVAAADLLYAGAAPNFAGLYQMSFRVPENTPAGQHAFSVMLNGVASAAGPKLEIGAPEPPAPPTTPGEDETPMCVVDLVVMPGEKCSATIAGFAATFEVKEDGDACAAAGVLSFCHSEGNLKSTLLLFGADAEENDDGSWTITKLPPLDP